MMAGKSSSIGRAVRAARMIRWWRCRLFETFGSARYARTALHDLDSKLAPYLAERGVFVEAGANDGFRKSNTYYLESSRGWSGVLVEPIPELAARCTKRRPRSRVYQCALVGPNHPTRAVVMTHADMLSEIVIEGAPRPRPIWRWEEAYEVSVRACTLTEVLSDAGVRDIDFLSLDLQGFEAAALAGLDFDRWSPSTMLIEILDETAQHAVELVLGDRYERVARVSPHDVLYRVVTPDNGA